MSFLPWLMDHWLLAVIVYIVLFLAAKALLAGGLFSLTPESHSGRVEWEAQHGLPVELDSTTGLDPRDFESLPVNADPASDE